MRQILRKKETCLSSLTQLQSRRGCVEVEFEFRREAVTEICSLLDPVDTHLGPWEDVVDKSKPTVLWTEL